MNKTQKLAVFSTSSFNTPSVTGNDFPLPGLHRSNRAKGLSAVAVAIGLVLSTVAAPATDKKCHEAVPIPMAMEFEIRMIAMTITMASPTL